MKNLFPLFCGALLLSGSLYADWNDTTYSQETIYPKQDQRPFSIKLSGDATGQAKFEKKGFAHQRLQYSELEADVSAVFYYEPCYDEGLIISTGFNLTRLDWEHNLFFDQQRFHTANLSFAAFSHRLTGWDWRAQASFNIDTDHFNFEYTFYNFLLWGRYAYCDTIGLHTGVIVETGMRIDHVYPIIGFDWQFFPDWKLSLVYPVNIALVYSYNPCWSAALAMRFFDSRHRVGENEPLSRGLFVYTNDGIELAINYDCGSWLHANVHAGSTFGGQIKVANSDYKHSHRFDIRSTGYIGGELEVRF